MSQNENAIDARTDEQKRAEIRTIITIGVNGMGELVVHAPFSNKKLCMQAIADAIKTIADYEVPNV